MVPMNPAVVLVEIKEEHSELDDMALDDPFEPTPPKRRKTKCKRSEQMQEMVECNVCHSKMKKFNFYQHIKGPCFSPLSIPCPKCPKMFPTQRYLKKHMIGHLDKRCRYCNLSFVGKSDEEYQSHVNNKEIHYKYCAKCGWRSLYKTSIDMHQKKVQ